MQRRPRSARDTGGALPPVNNWSTSYNAEYNMTPSPPARREFSRSPRGRTQPASSCCDLCSADPTRLNRKAFLVGINYRGDSCPLNGCINDVNNMARVFAEHYGFSGAHVRITTDNTPLKPTKKNILKGIKWLLEGSKAGDQLLFHYSGHGTQVPDPTGRESDRRCEALVPIDHQNCRNLITDDELTKELFDALPDGVLLVFISDCCHSGTMVDDLDVQVKYGSRSLGGQGGPWVPEDATSRHLVPPQELFDAARGRPPPIATARSALVGARAGAHANPNATVFLFSGCRDHQTSADAFIGGMSQGAFSWGLQKTLADRGHNLTYRELIAGAQEALKRSRFQQDPLLSTEDEADLDMQFMAKQVPPQYEPSTPPAAAPAVAPGSGPSNAWKPSPPPAAVAPSKKPRLGIYVRQGRWSGVEIVDLQPASPASDAGLREGDVVTSVNGTRTDDLEDFKSAMRRHNTPSSRYLTFLVQRRHGYDQIEIDTFGRQETPQPEPLPPVSPPAPAADHIDYVGQNVNDVNPPVSAPPVNHLGEAYVLGIGVVDEREGVVIFEVSGPAQTAGLMVGDVVESVAGRPVRSCEEFSSTVSKVAAVGVVVPIKVSAGVAMVEVHGA